MNVDSQSQWNPVLRRGFSWLRTNVVTIWLVALPFLILYGVTNHWSEIEHVLRTLRGADPRWVMAGIAIEAMIMLSPPLTYQVILRRLGHALPFPALIGMQMQRIVIGAVAPLSGPVSAFAFVRALNRRNVTTHDALALLALRSVATQGAFITLMLTAIALRGPIYALSVGAGSLFVLLCVAPLLRRASLPSWLGPWRWRRLPRSASTRMVEFVARIRRHRICASDLSRPLAISVTSRFAGIVLLAVSIKAMGVDVAPKAIATVIMAETVAKIAMPFFHGIGVVEAATAIALQQSGVPMEAAVGAALLWRAFEFWMPVTIALGAQAVALMLARRPRLPLPHVTVAPRPQPVLALADVRAASRRRIAARVIVVVVAFLLGRAASETSEMS